MSATAKINGAEKALKPATSASKPGKTAEKTKADAFKNNGANLREGIDKEFEGSKSDTVAFVATLGNPAKSQSRKVGAEYKPSYKPCGYVFKLLEDAKVPVAPLKENAKDELDWDESQKSFREGKAGEEIILNIVEAAMFISQVEYAGTIRGEGKEVYIYAKHSKGSPLPHPSLKMSGASIKEQMILIADKTTDEETGSSKYVVKPEYADKFGVLFTGKKRGRNGGNGSKGAKHESTKNTAAAFRQMYGI